MIRRMWDFMGSLKLTFWLLISVMAALFAGAFYSLQHYAFFSSLNEMRVQDWVAANFTGRIYITWWIPFLFLSMALLGVNTFICTCNRIVALFPKRQEMSSRHFFLAITPSLIHILFLIIIFGHLVTFTMGEWHRIPIKEGADVSIMGGESRFVVGKIRNEYYPDNSGLKNRIYKATVTLQNDDGELVALSFLKPVYYKGNHLLLDRVRIKRLAQKLGDLTPEGEENCNKAANYHVKKSNMSRNQKKKQELQIKVISDPGLYIIIPGFTLILILMLWYFVGIRGRNHRLIP